VRPDELLTLEQRISAERFAPYLAATSGDLNRPLGELHAVVLTTAGWICPTTRDWIAARSRVPALLTAENDSDPGRLAW
jgi:hypothetical protein